MSPYSYSDFTSSIENFESQYSQDINEQSYFGFPMEPILAVEQHLRSKQVNNVAYFSMEYGLAPSIHNTFTSNSPLKSNNQFNEYEVFSNQRDVDGRHKIEENKLLDMPIYGGGLGVLAGDTIKSAADLGYTFAGIGMLWNKGYFKQKFWYKHGQIWNELEWDPATYPGLIPLTTRIEMPTKEGALHLRLWKYYVYSHDKKFACPLILLDSHIEGNPEFLYKVTDRLYRSDDTSSKILQRATLGIGGMRAIAALDYVIDLHHLNEGHAAFALAEKYCKLDDKTKMEKEKTSFAYTCHTPVVAGHDRFGHHDMENSLTKEHVEAAFICDKQNQNADYIDLTHLCMEQSAHVNSVAQKHGEITRLQFPMYKEKIEAITNGIHIPTWITESFEQLFNQYKNDIGEWKEEPARLERLKQLKDNDQFRLDIFAAHQQNKKQLVSLLERWQFEEDVLTIGWARRFAGYKRPRLIFQDLERLRHMAERHGKLQILLAGKAHPNDDVASNHIKEVMDCIESLSGDSANIKVAIIENYDTYLGKLLTAGVDVWLNNPLPPFEASGTSGMKAILNGVPQLTTLDGWVVEAEDDDIGWIFGYEHQGAEIGSEGDLRLADDSDALYNTLEQVMKLYYQTNQGGTIDGASVWMDKMIHSCMRAAYFNTQRMIQEYNERMWLMKERTSV